MTRKVTTASQSSIAVVTATMPRRNGPLALRVPSASLEGMYGFHMRNRNYSFR